MTAEFLKSNVAGDKNQPDFRGFYGISQEGVNIYYSGGRAKRFRKSTCLGIFSTSNIGELLEEVWFMILNAFLVDPLGQEPAYGNPISIYNGHCSSIQFPEVPWPLLSHY